MNATTLALPRVLILLGTLAVPLGLTAQGTQHPHQVRYSLEVLGTLDGTPCGRPSPPSSCTGGTFSEAHGLNNTGATAGQSLLISNSLPLHAFFWQKGVMTDLGTLGGTNSLVPLGNHGLNERNAVIGFSETSIPDPNGEDVCTLGTGLVCLPFVWESGVLTALPTLGGNNGQALGINNRGQIVGVAETPNSDSCSLPFAQQVQAVIWQHGAVQEVLATFGGTAALASAINDKGQVVGLSGCVSGISYAVLWDHGRPINLGSLGGVAGNIPSDINNKGQVVGESDLPGDTLHHAFLWQDGVMTDLGSLSDVSPTSSALAINNQGQVVGFSQDANSDDSSSIAVLWQNGTITDLNTVIPADSPLFLMEASAINDRGEIAGWGRLANGDHRPFLLIPCDGHAEGKSCRDAPNQGAIK